MSAATQVPYRSAASPLFAALLLAACAGPGPQTLETAGTWTAQTAWRLEEDLRLGRMFGGGPDQFGQIADVLADARDWIYVLDIMAREIRVFRPDGSFSHRMGGKGFGPGELGEAVAMTLGPGDTLWVLDPVAGRYSAFDRDGRFLRAVPRQVRGFGVSPGRFLPDGRYLDWGWERRQGNARTARIILHPIALADDFLRQDSLPPLQYAQRTALIAGLRRSAVFFGPNLVHEIDRAGHLWFASNQEYRLYRRSLDGDTTLVVSLPAEAARVNDSDRDYVRRRLASQPDLVAAYIDALPDTRPVVHKILTDGAGHVFVLADVAGTAPGSVLDVFRESGEYLGRLSLPRPVPLSPPALLVGHASPDALLFVVLDDAGTPFLTRYRIIRPAAHREARLHS